MTTIGEVQVCLTPSDIQEAVNDLLSDYMDTFLFKESVLAVQPLGRLHYRTGAYENGCGRYAEADIMVRTYKARGIGRAVVPVLGDPGPALAEVQWTEAMFPALVTVHPFVVLTAAEGGEL